MSIKKNYFFLANLLLLMMLSASQIIPNNPATVTQPVNAFPTADIGPEGPQGQVIDRPHPFMFSPLPDAFRIQPTVVQQLPKADVPPKVGVGKAGAVSLRWKENRIDNKITVQALVQPKSTFLAETSSNLLIRPPPEKSTLKNKNDPHTDPFAPFSYVIEASSQVILEAGSNRDLTRAAISTDGKTIATTSVATIMGISSYVVNVWSGETGKRIFSLPNQKSDITHLAFSPQGDILATGSNDAIIKMWDAKTGEVIGELPWVTAESTVQHKNPISAIAFSPDGTMLAAASGGVCRLWELQNGRLLTRPGLEPVPAKGDPVQSIAFHPQYVVPPHIIETEPLTAPPVGWSFAASTGSRIIFWDASSRRVKIYSAPNKQTYSQPSVQTIPSQPTSPTATSPMLPTSSPSPSPAHAAAAAAASPVAIELKRPNFMKNIVVSQTTYGEFMMAASCGKEAYVWRLMLDMNTNGLDDLGFSSIGHVPHAVLQGHVSDVTSICFSPDGRSVVTGALDGTVRLWSAENGLLQKIYEEIAKPPPAAEAVTISSGAKKVHGHDSIGNNQQVVPVLVTSWQKDEDASFTSISKFGIVSKWAAVTPFSIYSEEYGEIIPQTTASRADKWREANMEAVELGWTPELWEQARKKGSIRPASTTFAAMDAEFIAKINGMMYLLMSNHPEDVDRARALMENTQFVCWDPVYFANSVQAGVFAVGSTARSYLMRELVLLLIWSKVRRENVVKSPKAASYLLDYEEMRMGEEESDDEDEAPRDDSNIKISAFLESQMPKDIAEQFVSCPNYFQLKDFHGRTLLHWFAANADAPADRGEPGRDMLSKTMLEAMENPDTLKVRDNFGLSAYDVALLRYKYAVELAPDMQGYELQEEFQARAKRKDQIINGFALFWGILLSPIFLLAYGINLVLFGIAGSIGTFIYNLPIVARRRERLHKDGYRPIPDPNEEFDSPVLGTAPHAYNLNTMFMEPLGCRHVSKQEKAMEESNAAWVLKVFSHCPAIKWKRQAYSLAGGATDVISHLAFLVILGIVVQTSVRGGLPTWQFQNSVASMFVTQQFGPVMHTFNDIGDGYEFMDWMNQIMVPSMYNPLYWDPNSNIPRNDSYILGLVRLRQKRVKLQDDCGTGPTQKTFCYPNYEYGYENRDDLGDPWGPYVGNDGMQFFGQLNFYYNKGGYIVDLPYGNISDTLNAVQNLQNANWIDYATRAVFVEFTIVNAALDQVATTVLTVELPAMGGCIPIPTINVYKPNIYGGMDEDWWRVGFDLLYFVAVMSFMGQELKEMKINGLKKHWRDAWNIYEFFLALLCVVSIILRIAILVMPGAESLRKGMNTDWVTSGYVDLLSLAFVMQSGTTIFAFILIFSWIRMLKFLQVFPFVGEVVTAIFGALFSVGSMMFCVIFILLIFAFGHANFAELGHAIQNYSELETGLMSTFRLVFLGDADYNAMTNQSVIGGSVIYVMMVSIIVVLVLNLFIGVLSEEYNRAKAECKEKWEAEVSLKMANIAAATFQQTYAKYYSPGTALVPPEIAFVIPETKEVPDTRSAVERRLVAVEYRVTQMFQLLEERLPEPEHLVRKKQQIQQAGKFKNAFEAAWAKNVQAVMGWVDFKDAQIDAVDGRGYALIHIAIATGMDALVQFLVSRGADLQKRTKKKAKSVLHLAAQHGFEPVMDILLKNVEDLTNSYDMNQDTPVHWAAMCGKPKIIEKLCLVGANPNTVDINGSTPLMLAAKNGHVDACKALIAARAVLPPRDNNGQTALEIAIANNQREVAEYLSNVDAPWALL